MLERAESLHRETASDPSEIDRSHVLEGLANLEHFCHVFYVSSPGGRDITSQVSPWHIPKLEDTTTGSKFVVSPGRLVLANSVARMKN